MNSKQIKKILIILLFNIVGIAILLLVLNYIVFKFLYSHLEMGVLDNQSQFVFGHKVLNESNFEELYNPYRKNYGLNFHKGNIILFGCSYAYGHMLEDKDTFHYKLSQKLKRPVYNYAVSGESTQFALMKIRSHTIDDVIKKSDYAILVTIGEHIWRLHCNSNGYALEYTWPRYDIKNGELVFHKTRFPFIEASYLYKYIRKLYFARFLSESDSEIVQNYLFDVMKLHYIEIKKELEKINPNIKVVIIPYLDSESLKWFIFSNRWKELEQEGFIIVPVDKYLPHLRDIEYVISEDDGHPSAKAWTEIVDLMTDKLKAIN